MKENEDLQNTIPNTIIGTIKVGGTHGIAKRSLESLNGSTDNHFTKLIADEVARDVFVVKKVIDKTDIEFSKINTKRDQQATALVLNAFKLVWEIPKNKIKVSVEDSWVTLEGELPWNYQMEAAQRSVIKLSGIKGITNKIKVKADTRDNIEKKDIELALMQQASISGLIIYVKVSDNRVTLNGKVESLRQKEEAGQIAWNAEGVWTVINELVIKNK